MRVSLSSVVSYLEYTPGGIISNPAKHLVSSRCYIKIAIQDIEYFQSITWSLNVPAENSKWSSLSGPILSSLCPSSSPLNLQVFSTNGQKY